jgi:hypothetical protein
MTKMKNILVVLLSTIIYLTNVNADVGISVSNNESNNGSVDHEKAVVSSTALSSSSSRELSGWTSFMSKYNIE